MPRGQGLFQDVVVSAQEVHTTPMANDNDCATAGSDKVVGL